MKDNVWFTYKARIQAHQRLEWLDTHSQFLLIWYAILGAVFSVVTIRHSHILGANTDILASVLSVAVLGVSLAVANLDFRGRAMIMRKNYLELHRLYESIKAIGSPAEEHINLYHSLLADSENHKEIDDKIFRVSAYASLTSRKPMVSDFLYVYCWLVVRILIVSFLYLAPIIVAWLLV